jgi:hypothetical protein
VPSFGKAALEHVQEPVQKARACIRMGRFELAATLDYGQTQVTRDDEFEHQRFSLATFVGVNFPLLKSYFDRSDKYRWCEPGGDESGIHSRLLSAKPASATVARFTETLLVDHLQEAF